MPVLGSYLGAYTSPLARGVGEGGYRGPFSATGAYTAVIGDSIDASTSWFEETCRISGQRMRKYIQAGVGGNTTTQMLARINTDVISKSPAPNVCVIGGPTNDHLTGITATTTRQNYTDMVALLVAAGIKVIIRNAPPTDNTGAGDFATLAQHRQGVIDHNAWLAGWAAPQGIPVLDIWTPVANAGTGGYTSGLTSDGTHPNDAGIYAAATYVSTRLPAYINSAPRPYLTTAKNDPLNIISDGIFLTDSNADGRADAWSSVGGVTGKSIITGGGLDGIGNAQRINASTSATLLEYIASTGFSVGDVLEFACGMSVSACSMVVRILFYNASAVQISNDVAVFNWVAQSTAPQIAFVRSVVPALTATIRVDITATGIAGYFDTSRATLRNRTVNP